MLSIKFMCGLVNVMQLASPIAINAILIALNKPIDSTLNLLSFSQNFCSKILRESVPPKFTLVIVLAWVLLVFHVTAKQLVNPRFFEDLFISTYLALGCFSSRDNPDDVIVTFRINHKA
jgi:hypothetical protein